MVTPPAQVAQLIAQRGIEKQGRLQALGAFGFEHDVLPNQTTHPVRIVNERTLHMDRITDRLRGNIAGFLKTYFNFPDDDYSEPGGQVAHVTNLLEEMFWGGRIMAMWSTDHAKSMTADKFFPILSLAENPDESHILVGANFADTKRRLQVVQRELETNQRLLKDFPWLKKPKTSKEGGPGGVAWSRVELTVDGRSANRPDPSLYACAIGSSDIRGRRGKLIMDDIEGVRNSKYALTRQELYDFVKLEATRCWEDKAESKRPLLIALGTPFDVDSIYLRLETEDWRVIRVPAYTVPWAKIRDCAYMHGTNRETPWQKRAALLPDRYFTWPRKRFKVTQQDPAFGRGLTRPQFSIQYLLDPTEGKPGRLSIEQMRNLMKETEFAGEGDWIKFVSLDPASGKNTRYSDYAGVSVVKLRWPKENGAPAKLPEIEVLEAFKFEQGLFEQVNFVADLCREHHCPLMFESNSQQGGVYSNQFLHQRPEVQLVPYYTTHDAKFAEEMGLTVVRTLIRSQRLKVPASQLDSEGMQALLAEIRDLGSGDHHDHIACSVWFPIRWLFDQIRLHNSPARDAPTLARRFGSGPSGFFQASPQARSWRSWRR